MSAPDDNLVDGGHDIPDDTAVDRTKSDNENPFGIRAYPYTGDALLDAFDAYALVKSGQARVATATVRNVKGETETAMFHAEPRFRIFSGPKIFEALKRREAIIPGVLLTEGSHFLAAMRSAGKTSFLVDMGCRIASDMEWHGLPVAPDWCVCYGAVEDASGVGENLRAWIKEHELEEPPARFFVIDEPLNLLDADSLKKWQENIARALKGRRAIVVVDTWGKAAGRTKDGTMDEAAMRQANANAEALAKAFNGPVVTAAHTVKDLDAAMSVRGSGVQEDDSTGVWFIRSHPSRRTKQDDDKQVKLVGVKQARRFIVDRLKGGGIDHPLVFRLKLVDLGDVDQFGKARKGAVVVKEGLMSRLPSGDAVIIASDRDAIARAVADAAATGDKTFNAIIEKLKGQTCHGYEFPGRNLTRAKVREVLAEPYQFEDGSTVWMMRGENNGIEVWHQQTSPAEVRRLHRDKMTSEEEIEFPGDGSKAPVD